MNDSFQKLFHNNKMTSIMVLLFGLAKLGFVSYRMSSLGYWPSKQFEITELAPTICKATVYEYTVSNPKQLQVEKTQRTDNYITFNLSNSNNSQETINHYNCQINLESEDNKVKLTPQNQKITDTTLDPSFYYQLSKNNHETLITIMTRFRDGSGRQNTFRKDEL